MMAVARSPLAQLLLVLAAMAPTFCRADLNSGVQSPALVTPVEKVVRLLEDLQTEVQNEGIEEARTYNTFACFCHDTTEGKSGAIKTGQDTIDLTSSTIEEKTATKATKLSELATRQANDESFKADLKATEGRCANEQAAYEATDADLTKAISSLRGAIKALSDAKPVSLLAVRASLAQSLALAEAMHFVVAPKRSAALKLLQHGAGVDPVDPEYKYHSQGVLDTVTELLQQFVDQKAAADAEWAKARQACADTTASLKQQIGSNAAAILQCKTAIETLKVDIAKAMEDLVNAEAALKDDQLYLKDLTERCEARAKDWDQRSQLRADELKALSEALSILKAGVAPQDLAVNKRALLLGRSRVQMLAGRTSPSFLQLRGGNSGDRSRRELSGTAAGVAANATLRVDRAMALLLEEGQRLNSIAITSLASRASADPFAKVKELIQRLVERLLRESTAEATKKTFCDTELGKATQDRSFRLTDVETLNVKIAGLEVKEDQLTEEIGALTTSLADLRNNLANATAVRAQEKAENIASVKGAREGLAALTEAIGILKVFYKQAAKAQVGLLQTSPVDEDTQGPGFVGAYKGKQESSSGIIGLLEVIRSDFERTIRTTEASEKEAAAAFVEFDRVSNTDISGKETQKKLNEEDLDAAKNDIRQSLADLQTNMDLLDDALKMLEELRPTCIDVTMPYAERVQKREEEIAALKRALCILDTEGVENC
mmetsp:Transcript_41895/g.115492  ORF Transcript_41895/g.115492 Transcript_41895/m.115492 type:complete len:719 (+) Transcript_41895:42-2198(+)